MTAEKPVFDILRDFFLHFHLKVSFSHSFVQNQSAVEVLGSEETIVIVCMCVCACVCVYVLARKACLVTVCSPIQHFPGFLHSFVT